MLRSLVGSEMCIRDRFYHLENTQVANYANDTTPFAVGDTWEQVRDELVSPTNIIFDWLPNNQMQGNADNKPTKQGNFYFGIRKIVEELQYSKDIGNKF